MAPLTALSTGEYSTQNGCALWFSSQARDKDFPSSFTCSVKIGKLINTEVLRVVNLMDNVMIFQPPTAALGSCQNNLWPTTNADSGDSLGVTLLLQSLARMEETHTRAEQEAKLELVALA